MRPLLYILIFMTIIGCHGRYERQELLCQPDEYIKLLNQDFKIDSVDIGNYEEQYYQFYALDNQIDSLSLQTMKWGGVSIANRLHLVNGCDPLTIHVYASREDGSEFQYFSWDFLPALAIQFG